jgi:hypothetical protein
MSAAVPFHRIMLLRASFHLVVMSALLGGSIVAPADSGERTLYNGIVLPEVWPPRDGNVMSVEPMKVPYLANPPKVIPIDVGRQLFVDDFLIEQTDLKRTFHAAEKFTGNPVLKASTKEELFIREDSGSKNASGGTVALLHGGAFYDPADQYLKLWFSGGSSLHFEMARSRDGIHWERGPDKIANPATVVPVNDCFWLDLEARDPAQRLKLQAVARAKPSEQHLHKVELSPLYHAFYTSANGAKWSDAVPAGNSSDYSSFFYNPFRQRWVYSIKDSVPPRHRVRRYAESAEFGVPNIFDTSVFWVGADKLDKPDPKVGDVPQLYSLGAVGYESLMLGMFYIHVGPHNTVCQKLKSPKHIDLKAGFSRDGFHWDRPFREPFIASTRTEGAWDKGYVHSPGGILFVMGDKLIFPYSGCSGTAPDGRKGMYAGQSIGLAMLRRDGFASMDAGASPGMLTTRPVIFKGEHLFVNIHAPKGGLRVEALDETGRISATSEPMSGDSTKLLIQWKSGSSLASLSGKPVRFRFHLTNGQLYSFWVTPDANGASFGYLGGGSPDANGVRDLPLAAKP